MRRLLLLVLLATCLGFVGDPPPAADSDRAGDAVLHAGRLLCLDEAGRFRAWNLADGAFDAAASSSFARDGILAIAARGELLFAADKAAVYRWSDEERAWNAVASYDPGGEELQALAIVGATPLLVFDTQVQSPIAGRTFKVPKLEGLGPNGTLRCQAVLGADNRLWIGTDYGEWGGHLLGLDLETGAWVQHHDAFHGVTAITQSSRDELIVSWAMRDRQTDTLVRVHALDGSVTSESPERESRYDSRIAWSAFDAALYGIENRELVRIEDGRPHALASLGGLDSRQESEALGVAPAIAELLPFAPRSLAIVPRHGLPWLFVRGELTRLAVPE